MMAEVVTTVGGVSYIVGDVARVSDLSWSTAWPYGCEEASFSVDLGPNSGIPTALRMGADVAIWDGPVRVWSGYISELETGSPWTIHAKGYYALVLGDGGYLAMTAAFAPTSTPSVAVTQAIARGWPVTNLATLSTSPLSSQDETIAMNTVGSLLDAYTASIGQRWKVGAQKTLTVAADPTSPDWMLVNTEAIRGVADDDYVTDIYARYVSGVTGTDPTAWGTAHVGNGTAPARREQPLDLTPLGLKSSSDATSMAQARLNQAGQRMGYTSALEVAAGELTALGGSPARLGLVKAGQMFRAYTVADAGGQVQLGLTQDVVIGRTQYADGGDTISLTPTGLAPRTLSEILAAPQAPDTFDGTVAA